MEEVCSRIFYCFNSFFYYKENLVYSLGFCVWNCVVFIRVFCLLELYICELFKCFLGERVFD